MMSSALYTRTPCEGSDGSPMVTDAFIIWLASLT